MSWRAGRGLEGSTVTGHQKLFGLHRRGTSSRHRSGPWFFKIGFRQKNAPAQDGMRTVPVIDEVYIYNIN